MKKFLLLFIASLFLCNIAFADRLQNVLPMTFELKTVESTTVSTGNWFSVAIPPGTKGIKIYSTAVGEYNWQDVTSNVGSTDYDPKPIFSILGWEDAEIPEEEALGENLTTINYQHTNATGNIVIKFLGRRYWY